jgi:serine/arginine repetitive matrix protein 2
MDGLTASPEATKTLVLTHGNIEMSSRYHAPFQPFVWDQRPLRILCLLPLAFLSTLPLCLLGRNQAGSVLSTASSPRPISTTSTDSRALSGSSTVSVCWDEQGLETVKQQRKKEREVKWQSDEKMDRRASKESR